MHHSPPEMLSYFHTLSRCSERRESTQNKESISCANVTKILWTPGFSQTLDQTLRKLEGLVLFLSPSHSYTRRCFESPSSISSLFIWYSAHASSKHRGRTFVRCSRFVAYVMHRNLCCITGYSSVNNDFRRNKRTKIVEDDRSQSKHRRVREGLSSGHQGERYDQNKMKSHRIVSKP